MPGRTSPIEPGALLTIDVEKPIAGGRMLGRHEGQVVFVSAAIPGERARVRVSRVAKGIVYADIETLLVASPDRRASVGDGRCGGNVLAHVAPERQRALKAEILEDAFRRLARLPLASRPEVTPSPARGYRMRARCHVRGHRIGFLREGSHELCDAGATGQLLPETVGWLEHASDALEHHKLSGVQSIELAENVPATERSCHLELAPGEDASRYVALASMLSGLSAQIVDGSDVVQLSGRSEVADRLRVQVGTEGAQVTLSRDVRAFFQGNRFLLEALVNHVAALVPDGPVLDLYAGVGLFGLSLASLGREPVTLVEGDRLSGAGLATNAVAFEPGVRVRRMSVEQFLQAHQMPPSGETVIVDPPRTGLSPEALRRIVSRRPAVLVYVSCDVATLARDVRGLVDSGFEMQSLQAFDLFPNTAHIETVASFIRE